MVMAFHAATRDERLACHGDRPVDEIDLIYCDAGGARARVRLG
jgi:hypothetical protein